MEYKSWFLLILEFSPIIWIWVLDFYIDIANTGRAPLPQKVQIQVLSLDGIEDYWFRPADTLA